MEQKELTAVEWLIEELVKTIDADNSQNAEDSNLNIIVVMMHRNGISSPYF